MSDKTDDRYYFKNLLEKAERLAEELRVTRSGTARLPQRKSLTIRNELDAMGLSPAILLLEIYQRAVEAYDTGRGFGPEFDPGPQYLAVAEKSANALARYYYPTMSAVKVETSAKLSEAPMSAAKSRAAIMADPFAEKTKKIANIATQPQVIQEMTAPSILPTGNKNES